MRLGIGGALSCSYRTCSTRRRNFSRLTSFRYFYDDRAVPSFGFETFRAAWKWLEK